MPTTSGLLPDRPLRVLVTGGAGYIGSHTVRLLRRMGHVPVALDTLEHGHRAAVEDAVLVVGSIDDRPLVRDVLRDHAIAAVVHFAALKSAPESVDDPARYLDRNVGGTLALLAELERARIGAFVFSSSCAVYGDPDSSPVGETAPTRPTTPYGESKLLVERALPWYETRGLRHVALRYFNAAGAEADGSHGEHATDATNLIPRVVAAALGQLPALTIFGTDYPTADGTAIRDYIHVADLADAHVRALEWLVAGRPSLTLNLGTGRGTSVKAAVAAVERAAGRPVPVALAARRAGDPAAIWADPTLARETLGWRARTDIEGIAGSSLRWQRLHPHGYDPEATASPGPGPGPAPTGDVGAPARAR